MTKMSDRRKDLRPREKLQARGAEALSDYELLMAIIGRVDIFICITAFGSNIFAAYLAYSKIKPILRDKLTLP